MDIVLVGIGLGLASVAGVRAFLPLALAALFAALGIFGLDLPFVGDGWWPVFGVLAALSVLEAVLDKVGSLERVFNMAMVPVRALAGGYCSRPVAASRSGRGPCRGSSWGP